MNKKHIDVKRFIFTGAPCGGKTSVIVELEKLEHAVIHEAASDLISKEQIAGIGRPWEQIDFVDKIILAQRLRQMKADGDLQFYDRSPFCTYALGRYLSSLHGSDFKPSPILLNEIERCLNSEIYQNKVFFFENFLYSQ